MFLNGPFKKEASNLRIRNAIASIETRKSSHSLDISSVINYYKFIFGRKFTKLSLESKLWTVGWKCEGC